jgi:hypothetical protein
MELPGIPSGHINKEEEKMKFNCWKGKIISKLKKGGQNEKGKISSS